MKKILFLGILMSLALIALAGAAKNLQPGTVTVYDSVTGTTLATFEPGASNTPLELNPGEDICFTAVIKNVGDVTAAANSYRISFYVKSGPSQVDAWAIMRPVGPTGEFKIEAGDEITVTDVCTSIRETAVEGTYPLWVRPKDIASHGPYSPDGQLYEDAITVLDSPSHESIDPHITWSLSWNPPESKDGHFLDISMNPVVTANLQVSNGANADIPFEGVIECNHGIADWGITDLAPGSDVERMITWNPASYGYSAGDKMAFVCSLYDNSGTLLEYNGYWPTAIVTGGNNAVVQIKEISLDKDSYVGGESGTAHLIIYNKGTVDIESGSTVGMRLNALGIEIANENIPFTLTTGQQKGVSMDFTIPTDIELFVDEITQCFGIDAEGVDYTTMQFPHSASSTNSPPGELCYTIIPASVSTASCSAEPMEIDGVIQQSCLCASEFCILDAPAGYFITGLDYSYPGADYDITNVRTKAKLYNFNHGAITVIYDEVAVPSMELGILCVGLLLVLGGFFQLRGSKDKEIEP